MKRVFHFPLFVFMVILLNDVYSECPPNIGEWDCFDDAIASYRCNNDVATCSVEFDYCIYTGYDGSRYARDIYIKNFEIIVGPCDCIDPEELILLYIFHHHGYLAGITGNLPHRVYTKPCWSQTYPYFEECDSEACCYSEYSVDYIRYYNPEEDEFTTIIHDIDLVSFNNSIINCEELYCTSNCEAWAHPAPDWDDYLECHPEDVSFELSPPVILNIEINKNISSNEVPQLNIFPNPANDILHIRLLKSVNNISFISINDINGYTVLFKKISVLDNDDHFEFDVSKLESGIYFILIQSSNKITIYAKIIIHR